jgi:DNA-directed RNA polymerase subunit RPC12/RpoP
MGSSDIEICSNCKREIPRLEKACIFDGEIVCAECDKKLRIESGLEAADLTESDFGPLQIGSKSELGENAEDKDIYEILGLDDTELQAPKQKQEKPSGDSELFKCRVCRKEFPGEEILHPKGDFVCKGCFKKWQKRQIWGPRKKVMWFILAGAGLSLLGAGLLTLAVWGFIKGEPFVMMYAVIAAFAVPCLGFGIAGFVEAWWLVHEKRLR